MKRDSRQNEEQLFSWDGSIKSLEQQGSSKAPPTSNVVVHLEQGMLGSLHGRRTRGILGKVFYGGAYNNDFDVDDDYTTADDAASVVSTSTREWRQKKHLLSALIVLIGVLASSSFIMLGLLKAQDEQDLQFKHLASGFGKALEDAWRDYEVFGLWVHEGCRARASRTVSPYGNSSLNMCSREEFRDLYEYINSTGIVLQSAQFMPRVYDFDREVLEKEARDYYAKYYPHVEYEGIRGFFPMEDGGLSMQPQSEKPFYFPVHYVEPLQGNERAIELDLHSSPTQRKTIEKVLATSRPSVTDKIQLVQDADLPSSAAPTYAIILHHPGVGLSNAHNLSSSFLSTTVTAAANNHQQEGIALMVIRISDILQLASVKEFPKSKEVYIYDNGPLRADADCLQLEDSGIMDFLGGARMLETSDGGKINAVNVPSQRSHLLRGQTDDGHETIFLSEIDYKSLPINSRDRIYREYKLKVADRQWTVVIFSLPGTYEPQVTFVLVGGVLMFAASILVAILFTLHMGRWKKLHQVKIQAQQDKAALIIETAKQQAATERQLNEYIAHEVRNPLSSAIAALSFVTAEVDHHQSMCCSSASLQSSSDNVQNKCHCQQHCQQQPGNVEGEVQSYDHSPSSVPLFQLIRGDLAIIDSSLHFIKDLLHDMLVLQRSANKQMSVALKPTDLLKEVLEPVASTLFLRRKNDIDSSSSSLQVQVECEPDTLRVMADPLRCKQVVLNLAVNACKFVQEGFVRIGAKVNEIGRVEIYVEDSGPGVPEEHRHYLFEKFQQDLHILGPGTGMGLYLCRQLVDTMGGDLILDESFESGIPNCPGSRFVVHLNRTSLAPDGGGSTSPSFTSEEEVEDQEICENVKAVEVAMQADPPEIPTSELAVETRVAVLLPEDDEEAAGPAVPQLRGLDEDDDIEASIQLQNENSPSFTLVDSNNTMFDVSLKTHQLSSSSLPPLNEMQNKHVSSSSLPAMMVPSIQNIGGIPLVTHEEKVMDTKTPITGSLFASAPAPGESDQEGKVSHNASYSSIGTDITMDSTMPTTVSAPSLSQQQHQRRLPEAQQFQPKKKATQPPLGGDTSTEQLPEELSVLFVDDDLVLRKLFTRSVRRVAPKWRVQEASSGEDALKMVEADNFDLIFLDQYMASVNKQLLGTETAEALRRKGVKAIICGLSANNVEDLFLNAGANWFVFKPFPCQPAVLQKELVRILSEGKAKSITSSTTTSDTTLTSNESNLNGEVVVNDSDLNSHGNTSSLQTTIMADAPS